MDQREIERRLQNMEKVILVEYRLRFDNIEETLRQIAATVVPNGEAAELKAGSVAIAMIARELVNDPDSYSRKRKLKEGKLKEGNR